ncbi:MAG: glycosyltransferase, partial [Acidobacteriota bacterium]
HDGPRGFGPACNRGAAHAGGDQLLILNDDVVVTPGVLGALAGALSERAVGAAGPNVWSERLGRSESGTRLAWRRGVLDAGQGALRGAGLVSVPYLCGAAVAVATKTFLELGGFDERLAPYFWEDVDLSLRLRRAGRDTIVVADAPVTHRHGATIDREPEPERRLAYERNRWLVSWRHLPAARWPAHLVWLPGRLLASAVRDRTVARAFLAALAARGRVERDAHRG